MAFMKNDDGKPDLTLLPYVSLANIAFVLAYGERKYSRDNWRAGSVERYVRAALRHLHDYADPTSPWYDSESRYSHLAHAGASILLALALEQDEPEVEDEYDSEA